MFRNEELKTICVNGNRNYYSIENQMDINGEVESNTRNKISWEELLTSISYRRMGRLFVTENASYVSVDI